MRILLLALCCTTVWASDAAMTLDTLVAKNVEARGGAKAWAAIETMRIEGTYTAFSETKPFLMLRKRPNLFYWDRHLGPNPMLTAYDGEQAWWVNPFYFRENARPMPIIERQDRMTLRELYIEPTFLNWQAKGYKLELLGKRSFEGADYWVIAVDLPWGDREEWYLDPDTFLEFRRQGVGYEYGRPSPMNVFYMDYRTIHGVVIPFLEEHEFHTRARTLEINDVSFNVAIADEKFAMPAVEAPEP